MLFFIDIPTRQVIFGGLTANPTGPWTAQAARNLFLRHGDQLAPARALVHDRGSQFTDAFDEVFRCSGMKILQTPVRTPVAKAVAESSSTSCSRAARTKSSQPCAPRVRPRSRLVSHD